MNPIERAAHETQPYLDAGVPRPILLLLFMTVACVAADQGVRSPP